MKVFRQKESKNGETRYPDTLLLQILNIFLVTIILLTTSFTCLAKGKAATIESEITIENFVGDWSAASYVIGTDKYSGYLTMRVMADGTFDIFDGEAGNPGIEGQLSVEDETTLKLICQPDEFNSPWPELKLEDQIEYHFYNSDQVRLTYKNTSIVFVKNEKEVRLNELFTGNWNSDLLKFGWYSNDGVTATVTYKLKMDNDTLLLYRVNKSSETLIGSFCGLSWNMKTGTIKTITELGDASKLPKNWRTMQEGRHFQSFKINYNSMKHCVTLTYNKKSYSFYANITYGVKRGSDFETVLNNRWKCNTGKRSLFAEVYYQEGERYVYIYDTSYKYFGQGAVTVDEIKKKVKVAWIEDRCSQTFYKSNNGEKSFTYTLKDEKLTIKDSGKSYTFTKVN